MSGVKHTPGPWAAKAGATSYPECDDVDCYVAVLSPAGREVVSLYERYSLRPDDRGCWEADARLIAAAPDLLEALEGLLGNAEIARLHLHATEEAMLVGSALFDTIQQARDAIHRATGDRPEKGGAL